MATGDFPEPYRKASPGPSEGIRTAGKYSCCDCASRTGVSTNTHALKPDTAASVIRGPEGGASDAGPPRRYRLAQSTPPEKQSALRRSVLLEFDFPMGLGYVL